MRYLLLILVLLSTNVFAGGYNYYVKIGTGYKFDEQTLVHNEYDHSQVFEIENSPYSARFEIGIETDKWSVGISHHSQWATGFPFNDTGEYYKTELFVDYKFTFGGS